MISFKGEWCYLYLAVDKSSAAIDFMRSKKRNEAATKRFFNKAIGYSGRPEKITIDKSGANNAALKSIHKRYIDSDKIESRQIKYLNNMIAQDHRLIKHITQPMMGFKEFHSAHATLMGIELHHMLHNNQHGDAENIPVFEQLYALAA